MQRRWTQSIGHTVDANASKRNTAGRHEINRVTSCVDDAVRLQAGTISPTLLASSQTAGRCCDAHKAPIRHHSSIASLRRAVPACVSRAAGAENAFAAFAHIHMAHTRWIASFQAASFFRKRLGMLRRGSGRQRARTGRGCDGDERESARGVAGVIRGAATGNNATGQRRRAFNSRPLRGRMHATPDPYRKGAGIRNLQLQPQPHAPPGMSR